MLMENWEQVDFGKMCLDQLPLAMSYAVSYTHLDVYKRQDVDNNSLVTIVVRIKNQRLQRCLIVALRAGNI